MNPSGEIVKQVADAFTCAETVAQLGMLKVTGAAAIYAAHIHQQDNKSSVAQPKVTLDAVGRHV